MRGDASQDWLATTAKVSRSIVSGIETGTRDFQISSLLRILDALQGNLADVIDIGASRHPERAHNPAHGLSHDQLQDILDHGGDPSHWISGNLEAFHKAYCSERKR